jgi:hypothetical protein
MQDIKRQLETLYYLREFILDFRGNLLDSIQVYNNMVLRLKEVGIPREIAENYEANYYAANIQLLSQIFESFSEVDIKYIDANIYAFEQLLDEAAGTSSLNKVAAFNSGTEKIKRKMEDEQETKHKQTQIITEIRKKMHEENGLDSYKKNIDERIAEVERQKEETEKVISYWYKQNQK